MRRSPPPLWDHLPCRHPVCLVATEPEWRYLYTPCAQRIRALEQTDRQTELYTALLILTSSQFLESDPEMTGICLVH